MPHDEMVQEIRCLVRSADALAGQWRSDDMDQYRVEKSGDSPMTRAGERQADHKRKMY
jgi:hypothetical protein